MEESEHSLIRRFIVNNHMVFPTIYLYSDQNNNCPSLLPNSSCIGQCHNMIVF